MTQLDHKHLIVNAHVTNPPKEGDEEKVKDWFRRLIEKVGMKIVCGPMVHYCKAQDNEGITGACCSETSHSSIHVWDKTDTAILRFDLYSCATFEVEKVLEHLDEFGIKNVAILVLDRNGDSMQISDTRFFQTEIKGAEETPH